MILVVGAGGFIGRALVGVLGRDARPASHRAIGDAGLFTGVTAVLHAGRDARLGSAGYRLRDDVELRLAAAAADRDLPFLSLGTCKVYAPGPSPLAEDAPLGPTDRYGEQKLRLENALSSLLGERLTRLRLANIFGIEPGRTSFMGAMLDGLAEAGTITFDMSPFTRRDFLPVETAAAAIARLARDPPGGIVNIGSGIALETGRLAMAVIAGRGEGRLVVTDHRERDGFVLDVGRMRRLTGIGADRSALLERARSIGRTLTPGASP